MSPTKRRRSGLSLLACSAVMIASCASTDYGTRVAGDRPQDLSTTEASLWYQMDEAETSLRTSGAVITDAALNDFVGGVLCDVAVDHCDDLNLYIVESPTFNAFMAPNGMSVIYSGMLLRIEDESQLAAVLSHEFVHFQENHTLEMHGAMRNARIYGTLIGSVAAAATGGIGGSLSDLATAGALLSFSREKEEEADRLGQRFMADAGYNVGSASELWENLQAELQVSDFERRRDSAGGTGFFDTHPGVEERIAQLRMRSAEFAPVETDALAYRERIRPFLRDWLDAEITLRDPGRTLHLVDRLAALETDMGVLEYARGRIYALRNEVGDADAALQAYTLSIGYSDAPANSWRGIAEIHRANGDNAAAADAFEIYLERSPDARDAALVHALIETLRGN